jgi:hypothetical protein
MKHGGASEERVRLQAQQGRKEAKDAQSGE